jgi:tetratricopeptide (TPR) repeat protein
MSFSFIPFILILFSLAVIIVIVIRKFPQLSLLDVENIPEVKQLRHKDQLLKKKAEKEFEKTRETWKKRVRPVLQWLKRVQLSFRKYVGKIEREVTRRKSATVSVREDATLPAAEQNAVRTLLQKAGQSLEKGENDQAEEEYIAVIKIDEMSREAYKGLAEVYINKRQLVEAEETLKFLLQLGDADDQVYTKLGNLAEKKGEVDKAIEYYQQAVLLNDQISTRFVKLAELLKSINQNQTALEAITQALDLEPNNPKYLDILAELAILVHDKKLAESTWGKLRMVNSENQKLEVLRERIDKI